MIGVLADEVHIAGLCVRSLRIVIVLVNTEPCRGKIQVAKRWMGRSTSAEPGNGCDPAAY